MAPTVAQWHSDTVAHWHSSTVAQWCETEAQNVTVVKRGTMTQLHSETAQRHDLEAQCYSVKEAQWPIVAQWHTVTVAKCFDQSFNPVITQCCYNST